MKRVGSAFVSKKGIVLLGSLLLANAFWFWGSPGAAVFWQHDNPGFPSAFSGIHKGYIDCPELDLNGIRLRLQGMDVPLPLADALKLCATGKGGAMPTVEGDFGYVVRQQTAGPVVFIGYARQGSSRVFRVDLPPDAYASSASQAAGRECRLAGMEKEYRVRIGPSSDSKIQGSESRMELGDGRTISIQ